MKCLQKMENETSSSQKFNYYDIMLFAVPVLLAIIVIIFRLIHGKEDVEFIGLNPNKIIEICSAELSREDYQRKLQDNNMESGKQNDIYKDTTKYTRGEIECKESLESMFNLPFNKGTHEFLRNYKSGRKLELDCYNEQLKLAVEYQGPQHYEWPNCIKGQTLLQFEKQIWRDELKSNLCRDSSVYLIKVPYYIEYPSIKKYIYDRLPPDLKLIARL